jgi:Gram-negative bacterial TonB protein C-terminal
MFRFWQTLAATLVAFGTLFAAEVEVKPKATATPSKPAASPLPSRSPSAQLPQFRPALLGLGPNSVINRIDTAGLIRDGQKDASLYFRCSVSKTGEINDTWTYRQSPDSTLLERELIRCLDRALFVPAVYDHEPVHVLFFGAITFKVINGKPRLRIFANQEAEELKNESDFVGPQPFVGRGSKFEGLHYPSDTATGELNGIVELAMKIDATGKLQDLRIVSEYPPLVGFRRAAAEDLRVATFIPAFRDGKPVECNVTLPIYYEP